ncbi:unnamed protein product [Hyaloperonospora brassicae]|uniref:Uncharacterized protein n=1 Tax=Hyaloperonospora brassicae TaxID=162125 RepID=A0AAV0V7Y4_HYABA|nr:unnamed protein product [Hyaloperonospora brassicae]
MFLVGVSSDSRHKCYDIGDSRKQYRKKMHSDHGRQPQRLRNERYEAHYGVKIGVKKNAEEVEEEELVKKSSHVLCNLAKRQRTRKLDSKIDDQCDSDILEGKELESYQRQLATKKPKK